VAKNAVVEYGYDKNGNARYKNEYDWVDYPNESGGALIRQTDYKYYAEVSDAPVISSDIYAYWNNPPARRLNAVKRQTIKDGNGNPVAATEYSYGNNNNDAYTNGNPTVERRWDNLKQATLTLEPLSSENPQVTRAYDTRGNLKDISGRASRPTMTTTSPAI